MNPLLLEDRGQLFTYTAWSKNNPVSVGVTDLSFQFVCHGVLLLTLFVMLVVLFFPFSTTRSWICVAVVLTSSS